MEHDGPQDGNSCNHDSFIMSPTLGGGKTSWSPCSREYLDRFLLTPQSSCVHGSSPHVNILQDFYPQSRPDGLPYLPGQVFDSNRQCQLRFGGGSRKSAAQHEEDVCRLLRCDSSASGGPSSISKGNTIVFHAHPALEGTSCGVNKVG